MLILTQNPTQVNKLETDLCGDHKRFDQKQCADQNSSETTEPNSAWCDKLSVQKVWEYLTSNLITCYCQKS